MWTASWITIIFRFSTEMILLITPTNYTHAYFASYPWMSARALPHPGRCSPAPPGRKIWRPPWTPCRSLCLAPLPPVARWPGTPPCCTASRLKMNRETSAGADQTGTARKSKLCGGTDQTVRSRHVLLTYCSLNIKHMHYYYFNARFYCWNVNLP